MTDDEITDRVEAIFASHRLPIRVTAIKRGANGARLRFPRVRTPIAPVVRDLMCGQIMAALGAEDAVIVQDAAAVQVGVKWSSADGERRLPEDSIGGQSATCYHSNLALAMLYQAAIDIRSSRAEVQADAADWLECDFARLARQVIAEHGATLRVSHRLAHLGRAAARAGL